MGREPVTQKPKVGLQLLFEERSGSIYQAMKQRFGPKRRPDGVMYDPGRPLPFSLQDFRRWMLEQFKGSWDNSIVCPYCESETINVGNVVVDHCIAVGKPWNGSLELSNLRCCCKTCNIRKGKMSGADWETLVCLCAGMLRWPDGSEVTMDARSVSDMLGRMANGAAYTRLLIQSNRSKVKVVKPKALPGGLF